MLIHATLRVESAKRPPTREILKVLKRHIPNKPLPGETSRVPPFRRKIWVSGCGHRTEYNRLPATSDYLGLSKDTMLLRLDSLLWKFVRWLPHWYIIRSGGKAKQLSSAACFKKSSFPSFKLTVPSSNCMATHPEAIKWEFLVEDDGDHCLLKLHSTKPQAQIMLQRSQNPVLSRNSQLADVSVDGPRPSLTEAGKQSRPGKEMSGMRAQHENVFCGNCGIDDTPCWHTGPSNMPLCNLCHRYFEKYGSHRPPEERRIVSRSVNPRSKTYSITTVSEYRSDDETSVSVATGRRNGLLYESDDDEDWAGAPISRSRLQGCIPGYIYTYSSAGSVRKSQNAAINSDELSISDAVSFSPRNVQKGKWRPG